MAEKIIVLAIVALAAAYTAYRFLAKKNRGKCSCGCAGCDGKNFNAAESCGHNASISEKTAD